MKFGRAIYWALGLVEGVVEIAGSLRRLVRQARKGVVPRVDDTQRLPRPAIPLPRPHEPPQRR